ncbi:hemerythrin domain-containing protein [Bordetella sp. 02P26C-1]|uniref:hemerythrin domain-containing protein n=1 Tax=Bordetella sp. 02P26C-1 TaxID=2683195 RepID=UPI001922F1D6|nr:hemerythrin domain-containing protein [Bordetella sp. 02P26C-1]
MAKLNIYEALRVSHEVQRTLCRRLVRSPVDETRRRDLYRELKLELAAHAAAEERFLYAPMLMDDMGLNSSRHALAEHHEIDECVEKLGKLEPEGEAWLTQAKKLSEEVHHHLREEEKKFFQVSGKILKAGQKEELALKYLKDYERMKLELAG